MIRVLMSWFGWLLILVSSALVLTAAVILGFGLADAEGIGTGTSPPFTVGSITR